MADQNLAKQGSKKDTIGVKHSPEKATKKAIGDQKKKVGSVAKEDEMIRRAKEIAKGEEEAFVRADEAARKHQKVQKEKMVTALPPIS